MCVNMYNDVCADMYAQFRRTRGQKFCQTHQSWSGALSARVTALAPARPLTELAHGRGPRATPMNPKALKECTRRGGGHRAHAHQRHDEADASHHVPWNTRGERGLLLNWRCQPTLSLGESGAASQAPRPLTHWDLAFAPMHLHMGPRGPGL